jgi:hypothetical protein
MEEVYTNRNEEASQEIGIKIMKEVETSHLKDAGEGRATLRWRLETQVVRMVYGSK